MKKFISLAMLVVLSANSIFAQPLKLYNGTPIAVRTTADVSSKHPEQATMLTAIVDRDVRDSSGEKILIRRGTPIKLATTINKSKGMGKEGSIRIECLSTTASDGQEIALMGGQYIAGDSRKGAALGCGLGLGLTFLFPVGFFFFCLKGENVMLPANSQILNVVVNDNYTIQVE